MSLELTKKKNTFKSWFKQNLLANSPSKILLAGGMAYSQSFLGAVLSVFVANDAGPMVLAASLTYWTFFIFNVQRAAHGSLVGNIAFVIGAALGTYTGTSTVYYFMG